MLDSGVAEEQSPSLAYSENRIEIKQILTILPNISCVLNVSSKTHSFKSSEKEAIYLKVKELCSFTFVIVSSWL